MMASDGSDLSVPAAMRGHVAAKPVDSRIHTGRHRPIYGARYIETASWAMIMIGGIGDIVSVSGQKCAKKSSKMNKLKIP